MFSEEDYGNTQFPDATFVPPEGQIGAPIMVIGEAPGKDEDRYAKPFVGAAGRKLNRYLDKVGIDRDSEVFVTNVIKRRPNRKNDMKTKEAQAEVMSNLSALHKEIRAVKPQIIVPMGNTALRAIGINWPISSCRGFIIPTAFGKVIPTFHPAFVFRQYQEDITCQKDWSKISRHMKSVSYPTFTESFDLNPTIDDVERFVALVENKIKSGQKVSVALDLETYYFEGTPLNVPIKLVGLAASSTHAIVIPFIEQDDTLYWETEDEELRAWTAIGNLLENPQIEIVTHNSLFDILVLMNHGFTVNATMYDTMIAQALVYPPSKHSLEYVASIYTDFPPWKLTADHSDKGFRYYNAKDATVLQYIKPNLTQDIHDNHLKHVFKLVMDAIVPTCQMMLNGLAIDETAYNQVKDELERKLEELTQELRGHAGTMGFNPNSTAQVAKLLFETHRLRSGVKTKGGSKSTDDSVLNRLSLRYPEHPVVEAMLKYRHYSQQYKTFIKNIYIHVDGRVHSSFKLHRTATGRYSSSEPNLQNLPARKDEDGFIRGLYRVDEGKIIVTADYSQIELMIFAELAGDEVWLEAFRNGDDVHNINSKALLREYHDPKYRTFVKNFIYGLIYGSEGGDIEKVAPKELIQHISIQKMMKNLRQEHPTLFTYREEIEDQVKRKKWVSDAYGRRRYFPTMHLTQANFREAYNHPIQGTAAEIMHSRTPLLIEALHPDTDMLVLQLHDAFYIETYEDRRDEVATTMKEVMERPIVTPMGHELHLRVDVEYGKSLAKKDLIKWKSI